LNKDSKKQRQSLRKKLLHPNTKPASAILNAIAEEKGYTFIVDISNPQNNVVWFNPKNDITEELPRRIDAQTPKTSEAAPSSAPSPPRPASPAPVPPRVATPAPTAPRPAAPGPAPVTPRKP